MPSSPKSLSFQVYSRPLDLPSSDRTKACLVSDNWDDFGFKTLYSLIIFDDDGTKHEIGHVKIGKFGMERKPIRTKIPQSFARLDDEYFSLGQDDSYYEALGELDEWLRDAALSGLRDVVLDTNLWERAKSESVTVTSLLRSVTPKSVEGQYRRLVRGGARLTEYDFTYTAPKRLSDGAHRLKLSFKVKPESFPPTNIHVLIGRNGVGKTHILQLMVKALVAKRNVASQSGNFDSPDGGEGGRAAMFANLVLVSFSAFDDFELIPEKKDAAEGIRYSYIGLRRIEQKDSGFGTPKSLDVLIREFVKSAQMCRRGTRANRWKKALEVLEADPIFREAEVTSLTASTTNDDDSDEKAATIFKKLSSGHKIVLLTITRLVETVEEQTLVLLDEPEGHLHPPLIAAFVRALSDLMISRNGVTIVATHSPVVLQEVPKTCVWTLYRTGLNVRAERPEVETFGENVGVLTREIFGYEVTESGFHKMLHDVIKQGLTFEEAMERFNNELGAEARAILRGLSATNDFRAR